MRCTTSAAGDFSPDFTLWCAPQQEPAAPLIEPAGLFWTLPFEDFCAKIVELVRFDEKYSYSGAVPLQ